MCNLLNNEITVNNQSHLFRYSGLVDSLKESMATLITMDISGEILGKLTNDYSMLREKLYNNYNDAGKEEMDNWCPKLDSSNRNVEILFYSISQLSKLTELIHQTNDFLLSQEVKVANAKEVASQIGISPKDAEKKPSVLHFGMLY